MVFVRVCRGGVLSLTKAGCKLTEIQKNIDFFFGGESCF